MSHRILVLCFPRFSAASLSLPNRCNAPGWLSSPTSSAAGQVVPSDPPLGLDRLKFEFQVLQRWKFDTSFQWWWFSWNIIFMKIFTYPQGLWKAQQGYSGAMAKMDPVDIVASSDSESSEDEAPNDYQAFLQAFSNSPKLRKAMVGWVETHICKC